MMRPAFLSASVPLARAAALAGALFLTSVGLSGCFAKPTMHVHHAEVQGVQLTFPPSVGILMRVVMVIDNTSSADLLVRRVQAQVTLLGRYTIPVTATPQTWLTAKQQTLMPIDVVIPLSTAIPLLRDSLNSPFINYQVVGSADVSATSSFEIQKDNYPVNETGSIPRQALVDVARSSGASVY
jgi:hypothetical protein